MVADIARLLAAELRGVPRAARGRTRGGRCQTASRFLFLLRSENGSTNILDGVRPLDRKMEDPHPRCRKGFVEKVVSALSARLLMAGVIQLDHELHRQIARIAGHEVKMLALNPIESLLPDTFTQSWFHFDDIRKTDFAHNPGLIPHGLLKHGEKGALRWGEKDRLFLIGKCALRSGESRQDDFHEDAHNPKKHHEANQRG
jgi:hypothetical protein